VAGASDDDFLAVVDDAIEHLGVACSRLGVTHRLHQQTSRTGNFHAPVSSLFGLAAPIAGPSRPHIKHEAPFRRIGAWLLFSRALWAACDDRAVGGFLRSHALMSNCGEHGATAMPLTLQVR
jgi:hypothetical protein